MGRARRDLGTALWLTALLMLGCGADAPPLTDEARRDVADDLKARGFAQPVSLTTRDAFVVADFEIAQTWALSPQRFGQERLLVIRETLLAHGYRSFRVNVNGPPPGTGLTARYGSARFIEGGSVEWLTP